MDGADGDGREATLAETACFELGIKFGALYHQFAGTPVSPGSAASLERAIEESIENQPHCTDVAVEIHADRLDRSHGYDELTGELMTVEVAVEREGVAAVARMALADGYPMMRVVTVEDGASG